MKKIYSLILTSFLVTHLDAQVFTRWDFDSGADNNTGTGTTTPSLGTGTVALVGGTTTSYVAGNPGSTNDNSAYNTTTYPAQGTGNLTRGVQFSVSTVGKVGIVISFTDYHSNTGSKYTQLQYTIDGTNWLAADLTATNTTGSTGTVDYTNDVFGADAGTTWYYRYVDLTNVTGVNNNANFAFRIMAAFDPATGTSYAAANATSSYATSGTIRYDLVQVGENSILPIHLTYFTAGLTKDNKVNLLWQTGTETGLSHFSIERSTTGADFTNIGTVEATGNADGNKYSYIDEWSYDGPTFYRLRMVNQDNTIEYGPVVKIDMKAVKTDHFVLYPDPVANEINLRFSKMESGDIMIYDFAGRIVATAHMDGNEASKVINVGALSKGTYMVAFYNAYGTTTDRFVKL